jgi:hypothetical protein
VREGALLALEEAENHAVRADCLTKPLTATLLARAAPAHFLSWSDEIGAVLELASPWRTRLAGVSLANLLNHTHGLDAPTVAQIPRTPDGWIDVEALCGQLAAAPLNVPGRLYSYSNTGAWFIGAALERLFRRPYSLLLHEHRLWPVEAGGRALAPTSVCPASGTDLELSVAQWLAFLSLHLRDRSPAIASLQLSRVSLPGWSPSERATCLGWKHYGGSWFGHNSNAGGSSALLRFNVEEDVAVVVEAADDAAFIVLAGLFGRALPEFADLRPPRILSTSERAAVELERYTGTYVQAQSRLEVAINTAARAEPCLTVEMRTADGATEAQPLRAAAGDLFINDPKVNAQLPFIQFVVPGPTGPFGYVWNGKQLWRRE